MEGKGKWSLLCFWEPLVASFTREHLLTCKLFKPVLGRASFGIYLNRSMIHELPLTPSHSSLIIDKLRADPKVALAYFYFDFRDSAKQTIRGLLCSLVFQIATSSKECFEYLKEERSKPTGLSHPTDKQLFGMLSKLLHISGSTTLIIDALDECPVSEREELFRCLKDLYDLNLGNLRLLVTTRPEIEIREYMEHFARTCSSLNFHNANPHKDDLARYISTRLSDLKSYKWGEAIRAKAEQLLNKKANGM
jgi:hypothetical protein